MADLSTESTERGDEPRWWAKFLAALSQSGNVLLSCKAAGLKSRNTAYVHRRKSPRFARRWDDALEDATDILEAEARRRGVRGIDRPVFYKGEQCGVVKEYSDTLLVLLLKANRPEKFREHFDYKKLAEELIAGAASAGQPGPGGPTTR